MKYCPHQSTKLAEVLLNLKLLLLYKLRQILWIYREKGFLQHKK